MAARRSMSPSMRPTTSAAHRPAGSSRRLRSGCSQPCWSSSQRGLRSARMLSPRGAGASRSSFRSCCSQFRCGCAPSSPKARTSPSLRKKATSPRRRCAKRSATKKNLKRVLIAFFGIMCAQGAVWYFTFFYMQVFLEKSLGLPGQTKDLLLIVMTVVSAPLYVYFGWLSDRHRPQAGDGRRNAARAACSISPPRTGSPTPPTRRWSRRSATTPVIVETDPATCSAQFDPLGTAKFVSACDIAKSALVTQRHLLHDAAVARRSDPGGRRHRECSDCTAAKACPPQTSKRSRPGLQTRSAPSLPAAGYPKSADPRQANMTLLIIILLAVRGRGDRALWPAGGRAG